MKHSSTHYGLKNGLSAGKLAQESKVLFRLECFKGKGARQEKVFLHILFLSEDIVRFHYSRKAKFNKRINSFIEFDNFSDLSVKSRDSKSESRLETSKLRITISKSPLKVVVSDKKGRVLSEDLEAAGFCDSGSGVSCYKRVPEAPVIYGLGDKTGELNKWGKRFRNDPADALGYDSASTDPLYKDIPFFIHLDRKSKTAHGIFFDNPHVKVFDFGKEKKPEPYYYFGAEAGELNYYFIAGPKVSEVVERYLLLTGKPPLAPKFTFGYLASGMAYTEADKSSAKILSFLKKAKSKKSSPTAFHLSSGYTLNRAGKRLQFKWNKSKFPSPTKFSKQAKEISDEGFEFCANVKPALLKKHPLYSQAARKGLFLQGGSSGGSKALVVNYWGGEASLMDFSNPATQDWWKKKLKSEIFANGIRGVWNDNNEYEIFEKHKSQGKEKAIMLYMSKIANEAYLEYQLEKHVENSDLRGFRNLSKRSLLSVNEHCENESNEANRDFRLVFKRPWVLSRSGYSGIQKYAQTWSGDNCSSFHAMKYEIPVLSTMSLSGLVHTGSDIGGFWGENPSSELLLRWVQNGVFSPRFCIHSYKPKPTEPWSANAEDFKIIQEYLDLRNRLVPYIYQANLRAHEEGVPIQRATVLDYQSDVKTYEQSFEYIFGDSLLIAPVFEEDQSSRRLYLPGSESWIDFWNGREHEAGQEIKYSSPRKTIPVFAKANSVVPMEKNSNTLELKVFLSGDFFKKKKSLRYELYEDDGDSFAYQEGEFLRSQFKIEASSGKRIKISGREKGNYTSPYKNILINICFNGKKAALKADRKALKSGVSLKL